MIRWMCGVSMKDMTSEELIKLVGSGRLKWYGHVMRNSDEDLVNKCMEYIDECRRPVGSPIRTWLESVDADMAELEIDREDVHARKK